MDRLTAFFRAYPALGIMTALVVVAAAVLTLIGWTMVRSGASLRPVLFFAGFFAIIVGPQFLYHVLRATGVAPDLNGPAAASAPSETASFNDVDAVLAHVDGRFVAPEQVFGDGFDATLLSDVRRLFAAPPAEIAQMAIFRNLETVVAARFADAAAAELAQRNYAAQLGFELSSQPSGGVLTGTRAAGDRVRLLRAGRTLFVWTAADDAALDRRMNASRAAWRSVFTVVEKTPGAPAPTTSRLTAWRIGFGVWLVCNVVLAALWFFKGSTWASSVVAEAGRPPLSAAELRAQLLDVETLGQPVHVSSGATPDEIVVTWRADAAWLDLARARGLRRTHKLVLRLDAEAHVVRVREYSSRLDWSAGRGGAALEWKQQAGIVFFQYEHERVFGLQLDPATGRLRPELSYAYTFNLQELKAPLIAAVTHAGWTWRPVAWDAPPALRWLTE